MSNISIDPSARISEIALRQLEFPQVSHNMNQVTIDYLWLAIFTDLATHVREKPNINQCTLGLIQNLRDQIWLKTGVRFFFLGNHIFFSMMASWRGNIFHIMGLLRGKTRVSSGFPTQRVCDVSFVVRQHKLLNKHSRCQWFETPWRSGP